MVSVRESASGQPVVVADMLPHNRKPVVPRQLTSFVGRAQHLADAVRRLETSPLLTLVGPGGVGKTRLAERVMAEVAGGFPDGAWFVALADVRDPDLVPDTVAAALGSRHRGLGTELGSLVEYLRDRQSLLVLDNCEHLLTGVAPLAAAVLAACPAVRMLATSRHSLALAGERSLRVPPLEVPGQGVVSAEAVAQCAAARLFVDRATAVWPGFTVTDDNRADLAQLCRKLEGMPLAIELAAVRVRSLSLRQLTERLSDQLTLLTGGARLLPARQRSLRGGIEWSHRLCTAAEQTMWARLSVFAGGFSLPAAEQVCAGEDIAPSQVLHLIDALVDKSILLRDEPDDELDGLAWYRMLEPVREYGHAHLTATGEISQTAHRHRDYYARLVARYAAEWIGPDQIGWERRMRREHPNLRAALDHCLTEPDQAHVAIAMLAQLGIDWADSWSDTEILRWLTRALTTAPRQAPGRAACLWLAGWHTAHEANPAHRWVLDKVTALTPADDLDTAHLTRLRGLLALYSGAETRGRTQLATAVGLFRRHGATREVLTTLPQLALATAITGHPDQARTMLENMIVHCEQLGEIHWRASATWALGCIALFDNDLHRAEHLGKKALRLHRSLRKGAAPTGAIGLLATVAARQRDHRRAATLTGICATVWSATGTNPASYGRFTTTHEDAMRQARQALGTKAYDRAHAAGRALTTDSALRYALGEPDPHPTAELVLSARETEVADLVTQGLTNREIATRLVISTRTAETHVNNIMKKLNTRNRAHIAARMTTTAM
jgi:non-specific serine/threonine protein kinase